MQKIPLAPLAVSPRDAARLAGVSRSRIYELINEDELPAYKDGSRTLIRVADITARLDRLQPAQKRGGAPTGPLLSKPDQALARRLANDSDKGPTGPLLPAVELAPEPSAPDLAAVYADKFKLIKGNVGSDEGRLRAYDYTVNICRTHHRVDLETAKKMTADAIKAARAKQPT
jgi:excisionase family DNA binding protein